MCRCLTNINVLRYVMGLGLLGAIVATPAHATVDGIKRLLQAYPEHLCRAEGNILVWCDGTTMPYDDGQGNKTHQQKLAHADLLEQMEQRYPRGAIYPSPPPPDFEPGRIRNEAFFKKMYGGSAGEVQKHLVSLLWLSHTRGQRVRITTINRVHEHLQAVSNELDKLPAALRRFIDQPGGAFNWRVISTEKRLSPHSFGIAFDINAATGDYWLGSTSVAHGPLTYRNRIPIEIVLIFEKHGFIWGGKWHHYDTLHFEYRPELLIDTAEGTSGRR